MADKKDKKEKKIILERVYNVPLRKKYQRAPRWKRTNRAVTALREFVLKNMKSDEMKLGKYANLKLWENGIRNPPHHIKVNCQKDEDGIVRVELIDAPKEKPKKESKKKTKKTEEKESEVEIEVKDALGGEDQEKKHIKEDKAEKTKDIEKEEIKELKKQPRTHAPKQAQAPKRVAQHPTAPMQKG